MDVKRIIKRLIYRYKADSDTYVRWLVKKGVKIGEGVRFITPKSSWVDISRPWLVSIGDNVTITPGVTIITHDYSWSVIAVHSNVILGSVGEVTIGNNVFIGQKSTILAGTRIGDNVIIGANSLVKRDIPSGVVVAGNPAKVICTLEEFIEKRKDTYIDETKKMTKLYYKRYGKWPEKHIFYENFWAFENDYKNLEPYFKDVFNWTKGDKQRMIDNFNNHEKTISSYEELIEICSREIENEER